MIEVAKLLAYISAGFFLAEYVYTFTFDMSIIMGKRQRRLPQVAYLGAKYIWITYFTTNLIALWTIDKIDCQLLMDFTEIQMGLLVCLSSFLLAFRTVCVYQGTARKMITTVLCIFGLGLVAAWMQGVTDVTSTWSPEAASLWTHGGCGYNAVKSTYWVKYVITIVFDLLVLVLTTVGIVRMNGESRIGDILIKHGVIYFILTFAANIVITVLTALQLSPNMSLLMAIPQSAVCVISSTRLYFSLVQNARPADGTMMTNYSNTFDSSMTNSKVTAFFRNGIGRNTSNMSVPTLARCRNAFQTNVLARTDSPITPNEDLEKALPISNSTSNSNLPAIRIDQSKTVEVDPVPEHCKGVYPFDNTLTPASEPSEAEVMQHYPRLLAKSSQGGDDNLT